MTTTKTTMVDRNNAKPGISRILTTMDCRRHTRDSTALKPMFQSRPSPQQRTQWLRGHHEIPKPQIHKPHKAKEEKNNDEPQRNTPTALQCNAVPSSVSFRVIGAKMFPIWIPAVSTFYDATGHIRSTHRSPQKGLRDEEALGWRGFGISRTGTTAIWT